MEPKFTVRTRYTKEEFIRFNRTTLLEEGHFRRTMIIANAALAVMIVTSLVAGNIMFAIPLIIFLVAVNWYFFKGVDLRAASLYKKSNMTDDTEFDLVFYDDRYEGVSDDGTAAIPYSKLYRIIETPTNYYILEAPMAGTILQKQSCPDGFAEFIKGIKDKYHV